MKDLIGFPVGIYIHQECDKRHVELIKKQLQEYGERSVKLVISQAESGNLRLYFDGQSVAAECPSGITLQTTEGPSFEVFVLPGGKRKVTYRHMFKVMG